MSTITQFPSGNTLYRIEFDYLARTFVVVTLVNSSNPTMNRVLEVGRDYRFLNPTTIEMLVDQSGFDIVRIHRQTGTDLVVDFRNGSVLTASDLTNAELQAIHIAEEGRDQTVDLAKEYADAAGSSAGNAKDSEDEARRIAENIKASGQIGYITRRSFEKGFNVTTWNEVLLWEEDGDYYRWDGTLPKNVPAGSTPETSGGIGLGAWVSVGDAALRTDISGDSGTPIVSPHKVKVSPQGTLAEMQFYVTPDQFGSYVDENTDFTYAVQAAIDYAATHPGIYVRGTDKVYGVGALDVTVGVKRIQSLRLRCVVENTSIVLGSLVDTGHEDVVIDDVTVDANQNVTKASILMNGTVRGTISNCRVFNNAVHADLYGIRIGTLSVNSVNKQNRIINNHITMPNDPTGGGDEYPMVGISLISPASTKYGGIDINGGKPLWPSTITTIDTVIKGNHIEGGTHGIAGSALFRVKITENRIIWNTHRNINLSGNCQRCSVTNNFLLEGGSSAVNIAWGCRWMNVTGNLIMTSSASSSPSDDAAIQMYKCVDQVVVSANTILGDWKYSVYLGAGVTNVTVQGNGLFAGSLASIAIESDWVLKSKYPLAIYSSSRDPNTTPITVDTGNINIGGNAYGAGSCAIYMTATNNRALYNVNIHDEVINSVTSRPHVVYAYDAGTLMTDGVLSNIAARGATPAKYYLSRGRGSFSVIKDVTSLDDPKAEFTVSGSTPSALFGPNLYIASGTITDFTDGQGGDVINVRMADGVILTHNPSVMRLKGGVNATASGGLAIIVLHLRAGVWFEVSRNF
jgi:hypothetical protein|nr:MAG TPA_asm: tailspike protein [Bacteriophage sp.]